MSDAIAPGNIRRRQINNGTVVSAHSVPHAIEITRARREIYHNGNVYVGYIYKPKTLSFRFKSWCRFTSRCNANEWSWSSFFIISFPIYVNNESTQERCFNAKDSPNDEDETSLINLILTCSLSLIERFLLSGFLKFVMVLQMSFHFSKLSCLFGQLFFILYHVENSTVLILNFVILLEQF